MNIEERKSKIRPLPPHIAWPLFIVALLLVSITAAVVTVIAAHSDGGAQVVEAYYEQAEDWNDHAALRAASEALGWQVDVAVQEATAEGSRAVELRMTDRMGQPLSDLTGTVRLGRPQFARAITEMPLPEPVAPGAYRLLMPIQADGLWDFTVHLERGGDVFETTVRKDVAR